MRVHTFVVLSLLSTAGCPEPSVSAADLPSDILDELNVDAVVADVAPDASVDSAPEVGDTMPADVTGPDVTPDTAVDVPASDVPVADVPVADTPVADADGGQPDVPPQPAPDCALPTLGSTGAVYYVCDCEADATTGCVAGDDDTNDGLSPAAPFRTYDKARTTFGSMAAGDTVALCRGGAFTITLDLSWGAQSRWANSSCLAATPCYVRDYDPGGVAEDVLPIIHGLGSDAFRFEDGGDADHEEGYVIANLDLRGDGTGQGAYFYNDIDDVTLCNLRIDNFHLGVHVAGSNPPAAGADGLNERIVLRDSVVTNNDGQGWLGACNDCGVFDTTFENNGFGEAILNHNIYFSGSNGGTAYNMRAVGNDLYRSAVIGGECLGVSLVVHGDHDGLLIEGNTVREDVGAAGAGCWGIAVDTGYGEAEAFRNVVIRGNTVINVGNTSIGLNACENCLIENNVVIHAQPGFGTTGIRVPDRDPGAGDLPMTAVTVRNNSVLLANGGTGIRLEVEGTDHVLVSNAVQHTGSGSFTCIAAGLPAASYTANDNNLCSDPGFTSVTAPDYDLSASAAGAAMVDAGHPTLSAPADISGTARDGAPDIGAHEF